MLTRPFGSRRSTGAIAVATALFGANAAFAGPFVDAGHAAAAMTAWASEVVTVVRGPLDAANPSLGQASFGAAELALGPSVDDSFDVVTLGDGGALTLGFDSGIGDGPGDDFAVFENGFFTVGGLFGELAFVEVSSDGEAFARFPATSLPALPVASFDPLDPSDYHGLAGRHPIGFGTGFDLAALAGHPLVVAGGLDLADVAYVRVVDVIGNGSTTDAGGAPVFDPYPTAWAAGGFDVEAVGVLHSAPEPATAALLAAGIGALARLGRRALAAGRCARSA